MATRKDMRGNNGRNWSESVELRNGVPWGGKKTDTVFGRTRKKPEEDDRPAPTPRDRNTGSSLARKLKGRVIG
jgi:hypothetical protein